MAEVNARVGASVKLVINLGDFNSVHIELNAARDVPEEVDYKIAMRKIRAEVEQAAEEWMEEVKNERQGSK